jgi:hypothetical protein
MADPEQRWRDALQAAVARAGGPSAVGAAGFDVQLRRWMKKDGPFPTVKNMVLLGELLGPDFSLAEQVRLCTSESLSALPVLAPEPLRSRRLLITKLWYAVNEAVQGRPVTADLVRAVLSGDGEKDPEIGRWRARQFDVPSGVKYKHFALRAIEFQRGPYMSSNVVLPAGSAQENLTPAWAPDDFERAGANLSELVRDAPVWIQMVLNSGSPVRDTWTHPQHPDFHLRKEDAYDRLELRWRLRALAPLVPITWYGELGAVHRRLLYNANTDRVRHIAMMHSYGEQVPDPAARIRPGWLSETGHTRLVLIAPTSALCHPLAALLAEAWAWQFLDARDLTGELTGARPTYDSWDRQNRLEQIYRELTAPRYADSSIVLLRDLDTIITEDRVIPPVLDLMTAPRSFTLIMQPGNESADLWKSRQENLLPRGVKVSGPNSPEVTHHALNFAVEAMVHHDPTRTHWTLVRWRPTIPWWPESLPQGAIPPFWDPRIGDQLLRAGYALATRLSEGRFPGRRVRKPPFVDDSLLDRFGWQLYREMSGKPSSRPNELSMLEEIDLRPQRARLSEDYVLRDLYTLGVCRTLSSWAFGCARHGGRSAMANLP